MKKIYITNYDLTSGGAGKFINTLKEMLLKNFNVTHNLKDKDIDILLINAGSEKYEEILDFKYNNPNSPILHRLDGLSSREERDEGDTFFYFLNNLVDVVIFQSKSCFNSFKPIISPKKYEIILNGSNFIPKTEISYPGELKIYHISWATGNWKQLDKVFDFIECAKNDNRIKFYLIGNYVSVEKLLQNGIYSGKDLKNSSFNKVNNSLFEKYPNVSYLGYLYPEEAQKVISKMDYLFFPSINDSCPNTVSEAICCHIPVIYHNSGGTPELVEKAGLNIVDYQYNYQKLILDLFKKKKFLKALSVSQSRKLSMNSCFDRYQSVIESAIKNKKKQSLNKENLNIGWILSFGYSGGSSRIGGFNIHNKMLEYGINSIILHENKSFSVGIDDFSSNIIKKIKDKNINVIILQKVCDGEVKKIIEWCKENRVKIVYAVGDIIEGDIYDSSDLVITGSPFFVEYLKKKYPLCRKIVYIEDGIETDRVRYKTHEDKEIVTLGWFGNKDKFRELGILNDILKENERIVTISNTEEADYAMGYGCEKEWSIEKLTNILILNVDIIVIPIDTTKEYNLFKSANRLTLSMSLSFPVIATPIPSYEYVFSNNQKAILFAGYDDPVQWRKHIDSLKTAQARKKLGDAARTTVIDRYSLDVSMKEWIINILSIF